jgi:heterodisulfide reductase subunit A-like polyferredoxin
VEDLRYKPEDAEEELRELRKKKEEYDMVVLSVGLQPCKTLGDLSRVLSVNLNEYGFIETDVYAPVITSKEGIYASGTVTEPKDIPESVTQASAAAAEAAKVIENIQRDLNIALMNELAILYEKMGLDIIGSVMK